MLAVLLGLLLSPAAGSFRITVVDQDTGRGVPLVELRTTNDIAYYTDSNGVVDFYEPELMGQTVFFHIKSHGYEFPKDGFGYRGKAFKITLGGSVAVRIKRINIAERLYRMTGEGIYVDKPSLKGQVTGQDSDLAIPYQGKIHWFFGDTNRPSYPLGNFGTSGATSAAGIDPSKGIDLTYFTDKDGFSRRMLPKSGPGPEWLQGLMLIEGRLLGRYDRIKDLGHPYERVLVIFNDKTQTFDKLLEIPLEAPLYPEGHPVRVKVDGVDYYYFSFSPPYSTRVRADMKHVTDLNSYERTQLAGRKEPLRDIDTDAPVNIHAGSVYWNEFRKRWIMIGEQREHLGEIWFAEADTLTGPWVYAKKIVTHEKYTFYNPTQHPFFDQEGGRLVYFSGTYASTFSGNPEKTPRYDYNIIMYRLALDDPRLRLPAPLYRLKDGREMPREQVERENAWEHIESATIQGKPIPNLLLDWKAKPIPGNQQ
jgi:hypothetical protein